MYIYMAMSFAGGVALFLLGMKLLTDGLKVAAGDSLRNLLARWTSTVTKGILSGILITALVQSSSAVIFATIGFVNAGLMSLLQAVYVIFGSNVGTTFTGWIVASVGLKVDLQLLAMPFLAIGMALWLSSKGNRTGAFGQALVGLSIFFLGIDILKTTFEGLGDSIPMDDIGSGWRARLIMVAVGILLTTVMQSSSAAIAIVITAAAGGLVPVYAAAAMVIGADIGTTSTAILAVIGSTSNAKRTASAHVAFNVVSGLIVLLFINFYLDAISMAFGPELSIGFVIAIFHTMKKLTGLAIMLPVTGRLVGWLEQKFVEPESRQEDTKYLDDTVLHTPSIAVSALIFELKRVGRKSRKLVRRAVRGTRPSRELHEYLHALNGLNMKVADFIQKMQRSGLPPDTEYALPQALRVLQYFREASENGIEASSISVGELQVGRVREILDNFVELLAEFCRIADSEREGFSIEKVNEHKKRLDSAYDAAKMTLLDAGSRGQVTISRMMVLHDLIRHYRRITDQLTKAAVFMDDFNKLIEHVPGTGPRLTELELENEPDDEPGNETEAEVRG